MTSCIGLQAVNWLIWPGIGMTIVAVGLVLGLLFSFFRRCQAEKAFANQEIHRYQQLLQKGEEALSRLAAIVESSDDAIFSLAPDGTIVTWNAGAEHMYGYPAAEIMGRSFGLLAPAESFEDLAQVRARINRGDHAHPQDAIQVRKDQKRVDVSLSMSPIKDAAGQVTGASVIARDISERKRLEQQFRQAQKMEAVGRLAGGVAHDFNNLLTIIMGYGDVLLSRFGQEDPAWGLVHEIKRAGDRAASLTRQLLAFSRKQVLVPRIVDLNGLVSEMDKMLRRMIGEDIDLATSLDSAVYPVKVDPGQIEQVLMNLAVNARDAMPGGGKLTIETANVDLDTDVVLTHPEIQPGPYVMLAVSDTGIGMDAETRARLFEPFFTTKESGKGTGLGLATVYGIIKQSGGYIYVYSEPGHGTAFKVYLPRAQESLTPTAVVETKTPPPRGSETILLVEDDEMVRMLARRVLQTSGYSVLEARHGAEALLLAEQYGRRIHLLVTDVVMPQMNGRELANQLRAQRPELKVLFLSGYTDDAIVHHQVLESKMAFLQKPFKPDALARKVRMALDESPQ